MLIIAPSNNNNGARMKKIDWDLEGEALEKAIKQHEAEFREVSIGLSVIKIGVSISAVMLAAVALIVTQVRALMGV